MYISIHLNIYIYMYILSINVIIKKKHYLL